MRHRLAADLIATQKTQKPAVILQSEYSGTTFAREKSATEPLLLLVPPKSVNKIELAASVTTEPAVVKTTSTLTHG
jgi:hypothetical protein